MPLRTLSSLFLLVALLPGSGRAEDGMRFFEEKIRPVLVRDCYRCHSAESGKSKGGLRLDSREALRKGGDGGPAVLPGRPEESRLIRALRYKDRDLQMPPKGRLADPVVEDFVQWVRMGAPDPREDAKAVKGGPSTEERGADHWAFRKPVLPSIPEVKQEGWARGPVDRFVLARLEAKGLTPSAGAGRGTLIRRLYFDLIGLPPTAEEVERFQNDPSPDAYELLVDQLLTSPRFGERWARYWMDVARYADTKGYVFTEDRNFPTAYKYRDWLVESFNRDRPYDRFLMQQLAADRLSPEEQRLEAMGFLTLGRRFLKNNHDIIDDRIDVVTRGLMGLTVTCARCHDHKYDPISQSEYYALYRVFFNSESPGGNEALHLTDRGQPRDVRVFLRGNPANQGPIAVRHMPHLLFEGEPAGLNQGSGRLEMAKSIATAENPLTARVFINRVWRHLFGRGLVEGPSDFGTRSAQPSHPELLDYLAVRFVEEGWSIKTLIRGMVLSQTYRQSSRDRPEAERIDPENQLLWRMNRRRLDFEAVRDYMLAASGALDLTSGGPSVDIIKSPYSGRRTIYGRIDRQNLPGLFRTFDFASPDTHSPRRYETNVPQQGLFLLNSPFVMDQAAHLVARREVASAEGPREKVRQLCRLVYGRDPSPEEAELLLGFVERPMGSWERLAQTLLISNELHFID